MKKYLFFVIVVCSFAANDNTLLSGDYDHGGYGAFDIGVSEVLDKPALLLGGRGGWIINHTITIGGAGWGMSPYLNKKGLVPDNPDSTLALTMGAGGFLVEYTLGSDKLVHFNLGFMIGYGGIAIGEKNFNHYDDDNDDDDDDDDDDNGNNIHDGFFICEPNINLEVNITQFMRVDLGISYRYTDGISEFHRSDDEFSGITGRLQFRFGKF